ncbi:MAG: hypothetical protein Q9174_005872 [Haloplaca sp. 1 TL-2023]
MSSHQSRKRPAEDQLSDPPSPSQPEEISARHTPGNSKIPRRGPDESAGPLERSDFMSLSPDPTDIQPSEEWLPSRMVSVDEHFNPQGPSGPEISDDPLADPNATPSVASSDRRWIVRLYIIHTTSDTGPGQLPDPDLSFQSVVEANNKARDIFAQQMHYYDSGDSHTHMSSGPTREDSPLSLLGWAGDNHISCYVYDANGESAFEDNVTETPTSNDLIEAEVEEGAMG